MSKSEAARQLEPARLAAGSGALLEDEHVVARLGQTHGAGQPPDPRAGDDHPHAARRARSAGAASRPIATPPASATRGRRQITALAAVSPAHVHT